MNSLYKTLQQNTFVIAGPCVIESKEQCLHIAKTAKEAAEKKRVYIYL